MNKKTMIAAVITLVMLLSVFVNSTAALRMGPRRQPEGTQNHPEELTLITIFDEGCNGWKFFSIPFDAYLSEKDIRVTYMDHVMTLKEAVNQNIIHRNIFVYDNAKGRWEHTHEFETGNAYLAYVYVSENVTLSAVGTFEDSYEPVILYQGWNYFGIPVSSTIPASNLRFSCEKMGLEHLTLQEAQGTLVSGYICHATNSNPMYELLMDNDAEMIPGDVYLIVGLVDGVIMEFTPVM